jgi:hypothetical protein
VLRCSLWFARGITATALTVGIGSQLTDAEADNRSIDLCALRAHSYVAARSLAEP